MTMIKNDGSSPMSQAEFKNHFPEGILSFDECIGGIMLACPRKHPAWGWFVDLTSVIGDKTLATHSSTIEKKAVRDEVNLAAFNIDTTGWGYPIKMTLS